jgi:hypothetical protein
MSIARTVCGILLALTCAGGLQAQETIPQLQPGSARKAPATGSDIAVAPAPPQFVALELPKGTPLQVALDRELRVKKAGQPVHARIVEPVYAFDHVVIPVGSEVTGEITKLSRISAGKRALAALDADFTPVRVVEVGFSELVLPDGRRLSLETTVTPGSGQVIELVTAADAKSKKKGVKDMASEKAKEAKQQAKQQWNSAMKQLKVPGRAHRMKRYVEAQLPVHAQYVPAGTVYFVELNRPLDFGREAMTAQMASSIGGPLPPGSVLHARLVTALSSATTPKGQEVEAVLSRPVMDADHQLILAQGSRLKGTVRQVQPARRMKKNGQLRLSFEGLILPDGVQQKVEATLEGVQAGKDANVKLDSEGGAEATTPKARYMATAFSLTLAAAAMAGDDADAGRRSMGGDTGPRVAGGANGFKLVGIALGAFVHSRALGAAMGAYGAGMSVYSNFLAKGREVVFPKNTAMEIGVGTRQQEPPGGRAASTAAGTAKQ